MKVLNDASEVEALPQTSIVRLNAGGIGVKVSDVGGREFATFYPGEDPERVNAYNGFPLTINWPNGMEVLYEAEPVTA